MKRWFLILAAALTLSGCGYNDFQKLDEQTKLAWSEVLNQYQRRADLVPNLVDAMFVGFPGNSGETLRISIAPENQRVSRND